MRLLPKWLSGVLNRGGGCRRRLQCLESWQGAWRSSKSAEAGLSLDFLLAKAVFTAIDLFPFRQEACAFDSTSKEESQKSIHFITVSNLNGMVTRACAHTRPPCGICRVTSPERRSIREHGISDKATSKDGAHTSSCLVKSPTIQSQRDAVLENATSQAIGSDESMTVLKPSHLFHFLRHKSREIRGPAGHIF
jgi:hypothetical protein